MSKIIGYISLLTLTLFLGDRYLIYPVAGQNLPTKEPLQFKPPNNGAPGGNRSGSSGNTGSRPICPTVEKDITALIPKTNWANTLAERPTFWFYIPYERGRLKLILKDEGKSTIVARVNYEVNKGGGIMGFPIPETSPALEVNRAYRWQVSFSCEPNIEPSFTGVQGVVERVAKNEAFKTKLTSTTTIQGQINLYANQGLWHETISTLIQLRRSKPTEQELKQDWSDLLSNTHVELAGFISEPLVECCNPIPE
ncbi:DUF928 domain-containing protein [Nostoc sp. ChiVER01]|uniref:DUF928 domain-containing protein n=1 Tax=Nostoc sp. ChiVER01 TaxID=3075382 RepID=UPI002AD294D0|nr:DUF928 domain-containing protein [Nostoc sp. ChiVER01]MDZ8226756.1 DUF928 domain-containing protein [Nostoc sp. ChiVER01]